MLRTVIPFFLGCLLLSALVVVGTFLKGLGPLLRGQLSLAAFLAALLSPLLIFGLGGVGVYNRSGSRGVSERKRLVVSLTFATLPLLVVGLFYLVDRGARVLSQLHHGLDTERSRTVRDGTRFKHLQDFKLGLRNFAKQRPGAWLGEPRTVYLSVPDSDPACGNLGLPALPEGWSYRCAPEGSVHLSNGTGWIPVNFNWRPDQQGISFLSGVLPIDPLNTIESGQFYQLSVDEEGGWLLQARFASQEYAHRRWNPPDSDENPSLRIRGKTLSLTGLPPRQAPEEDEEELLEVAPLEEELLDSGSGRSVDEP